MPSSTITIVGAGILGLWQALTLARAGHKVTLIERSPPTDPFAGAASRYAGAMLAPDTEAEAAPTIVRDLGRAAIDLWAAAVPITRHGSLVIAPHREPGELRRFARLTERHVLLGRNEVANLEPDIAGRFETGLFFSAEAHVSARDALSALVAAARTAGATIQYSARQDSAATEQDWLIDCRGLAARSDIPDLRGVRGERMLLHAPEVTLSRPVRYLDPRTPLYIVPWPGHVFMAGATVIESEDNGPMSVRSATELMAAVIAVHPGFAEAAILETGAGVRPSLPDNVPRAIASPATRIIRVNGAYRHGFLLAPILAQAVEAYIANAAPHPLLEA
ncbi:MAG: FAD-dependent oxidoreductase [Hyphomicrobiaceae bacterium]|nr:FAD-dependent oxidoreductase [Hyphomicrobiaceae bacterium]